MAAHGIPCDTINHCDFLSPEAVMVHVCAHTIPQGAWERCTELSWETLVPCSIHSSLRGLGNIVELLSGSDSSSLKCDHAAEVRIMRLDLGPSQLLDAVFREIELR